MQKLLQFELLLFLLLGAASGGVGWTGASNAAAQGGGNITVLAHLDKENSQHSTITTSVSALSVA